MYHNHLIFLILRDHAKVRRANKTPSQASSAFIAERLDTILTRFLDSPYCVRPT